MTFREMVLNGTRGGFAKNLVKFYDSLQLSDLMDAWAVADSANRAALAEVFVGIEGLFEDWCELDNREDLTLFFSEQMDSSPQIRHKLQFAFLGLVYLEEEVSHEDGLRISIRTP